MRRFTFFLFWVLLLLTGCTVHDDVMVIGHRGAMGYETENTLASVQKALDLGADAVEIDVFRIRSGELVVFHDQKVDRLTNGGGNIEEYDILDVKSLLLEGNHRIPILQDVLKLVNRQCILNIELKSTDMSAEIDHVLRYYVDKEGWQYDDFIVSGFKWNELTELRKRNRNIPIALLTGEDPLDAIGPAKRLGAVAINPEYTQLTEENVQQVQNSGFKVFAWTVNDPEDIAKVRKTGVDGIITDFPDRAR